jgi:hypothetical protein
MIYDSIEPLTPISDPTVVNSGLSSMKPRNTKSSWHQFGLHERLKGSATDLQQQVRTQSTHSVR